ncbi:MAG: three-Cys-motif partner protein TcmP [Gammaproteobacteria bacterium]|nr:three-Cys-motif partner protein TcmP [Gammaproteobacteria bacterium]
MTRKSYDWDGGAKLEEHTKKKHFILREYFREYLITRCQLPQQEKFRLAIVDGFTGAGLYKCGSFGSPMIFVNVLTKTANEINLHRLSQGMRLIIIECLLIFNDQDKFVIDQLRENIAPLFVTTKDDNENIYIETEFLNNSFEVIYPQIKQRLLSAKYHNVLFNLDQCGYSHVPSNIIRDIVNSWRSAEVLLTFMISSLLAYLSPQKEVSGVPLEAVVKGKIDSLLKNGGELLGKAQWLGEAEKIVYSHYKSCATYVSPFSINNPKGWRYWLMHFASSYRARQVYNNILHQDGESQAHFGRSGLHMLSYNSQNEGQLYLFNNSSRQSAKEALYNDIPRFVAESGDTLAMQDFYAAAYSETPAHSDDIHEMIIENPDMEVITESGGKRRQPNTVKAGDTLKLKSQKSMFFMFSGTSNGKQP